MQAGVSPRGTVASWRRLVLDAVEHGAKLEKRASDPPLGRASFHTLTLARLYQRTVVLGRLKAAARRRRRRRFFAG